MIQTFFLLSEVLDSIRLRFGAEKIASEVLSPLFLLLYDTQGNIRDLGIVFVLQGIVNVCPILDRQVSVPSIWGSARSM